MGGSPVPWPWRRLLLTLATSADMMTSTASECEAAHSHGRAWTRGGRVLRSPPFQNEQSRPLGDRISSPRPGQLGALSPSPPPLPEVAILPLTRAWPSLSTGP